MQKSKLNMPKMPLIALMMGLCLTGCATATGPGSCQNFRSYTMSERVEVNDEIKLLQAIRPKPRIVEWIKDYKVMRDDARSCHKIMGK